MKLLITSFLFLCFVGQATGSDLKDILDDYQTVQSSDLRLENMKTPEVKLSRTGKSFMTFNKMGFDTTSKSNNWLEEEFLRFVESNDKDDSIFFEVGCGYGNTVEKFFEVSRHGKIIANDVSEEHLLITRSKISPENHERLFMNLVSFSDYDSDSSKKIKAIMMHRVIHLFSGQQVDDSLKNAYAMLDDGGKLFVAVNTPLNKDYSSWFLPEYEENISAGKRWPGEFLPVARALPKQTYALPEYLHVMDQRVLHTELEKAGFQIEKSDFISMKKFQTTIERDGREIIAVVAVKPAKSSNNPNSTAVKG